MQTQPIIRMDQLFATGRIRGADIDGFAERGFCVQMTYGRRLFEWQHAHDFYEMIYVVSGSCTHDVNGVETVMPAGSLTLLRPEDVHCFSAQSEGVNVASLSVTCEEVARFLAAYRLDDALYAPDAPAAELPPSILLSPDERIRMERLFETAVTSENKKAEDAVRAILGQSLSYFLERRHGLDNAMPADFSHAVAEMNRLENAAEGVTAFLRLSNFSYSQLRRLTCRYLGTTPGEYINSLRLKHAYALIAYSELDYAEICEMVGFRSFSHFSSLIRKHFRQTPAQIRRFAGDAVRTV